MKSLIRIASLAFIVMILLYACGRRPTPTPAPPQPILLSTAGLSVTVTNGSTPFSAVGQVINYSYAVSSIGSGLPGPVSVTDDKTTVPTCLGLNTVGNLDNNLDIGEIVTCTSSYTIQPNDLTAGAVTSNAIAKVGTVDSNRVTTTVRLAENKVLTLTASASPTSYAQANQPVTFTLNLKNTGTTAVGPAQFVVREDRMGSINCGGGNSLIGPTETLTCYATYNTSQNDLGATQLTFNFTASGGGAGSVQTASVVLAKSAVPTGNLPACSLTPGITCQYQLVEGDWMMQVYRCFGKAPEEVYDKAFRDANPSISDPATVKGGTIVTIPNIGNSRKIYGAPCTTSHTVQAGDTWDSIALKYNAARDVLLEANKNVTLSAGVKLKIPLNSAGGNQAPPPIDAIRLNITAGSAPTTLQGTLEVAKGKIRYVLAAVQGQTLSVKLTAPVNEVALAIYTPSNTALKAQDTTLTWTGILPATGDYSIELVSVSGASNKLYTLEVGLTQPVSAFQRVADVNTGAGDSNPSYLAVFNGALYFNAAGYDNTGAELWKYDPVSNAASRVADIFPGATGSNPTSLASYNGALYFGANANDGAGTEIWRFNGSAVGRLSDMNGGAGNANPMYMTVYNNILYFSANGNDGAGVELWKTDGNTTSRVTDIYNGTGDANPAYLAVYNNALYFSAISNDGMGNELWRFDGTTATRVTDINPNVGNSNPAYLTVFNGVLYFSANANDGTGTELWKYDGTTASRAADINAGAGDSIPAYLTLYGNALYFSANGNDGKGLELWKFDGTTASRVSDINTAGDTAPAYLMVFNNELFFQANGGDGTGRELWKYKAP